MIILRQKAYSEGKKKSRVTKALQKANKRLENANKNRGLRYEIARLRDEAQTNQALQAHQQMMHQHQMANDMAMQAHFQACGMM